MALYTSTATYYCRTTGHFAVLVMRELANGDEAIEMTGGRIRQGGPYWYFTDTGSMVRRHFSTVGPVMKYDCGPRTDATWTFRSKAEFDLFCQKLVGHTVDDLANATVELEAA